MSFHYYGHGGDICYNLLKTSLPISTTGLMCVLLVIDLNQEGLIIFALLTLLSTHVLLEEYYLDVTLDTSPTLACFLCDFNFCYLLTTKIARDC